MIPSPRSSTAAPGSSYPSGEHGHRTAVDSLDRKTDRFSIPPKSYDVNQRQIVIGRGNGQRRVVSKRLVGNQRSVVACKQQLAGFSFESHGPFEGFRPMPPPRIGVQVVNEIAASENQDPFVAQRRKSFPDFIVVSRRLPHHTSAHEWVSFLRTFPFQQARGKDNFDSPGPVPASKIKISAYGKASWYTDEAGFGSGSSGRGT